MSLSSSPAASSLPLAGVRIFLCIRNAPATKTTAGRRDTAKQMLKTARAQVQQLGATLALSEAAADLVVFHHGSPSLLEALHAKYKAVVQPDYLTACANAHQRVHVTPYLVPRTDDEKAKEAAGAAQIASTSTRTSTSRQSTAAHTPSPPSSRKRNASTSSGKTDSATKSQKKSPPQARKASPSRSVQRASKEAPAAAAAVLRTAELQAQTGAAAGLSARRFLILDDEATEEKEGLQCGTEPAPSPALTEDESRAVGTKTEEEQKVTERDDTVLESATHLQASSAALATSASTIASTDATPPLNKPSQSNSVSSQADLNFHSGAPPTPPHLHLSVADTSSLSVTPRLTPTHHHHHHPAAPSPSLSLATTQEIVAAHPCNVQQHARGHLRDQREGEKAEREEEERIRHVVLRSTAAAAVTRRRGRPRRAVAAHQREPSNVNADGEGSRTEKDASFLLQDGDEEKKHSRRKAKLDAVDPFLASQSNTQLSGHNHLNQQQQQQQQAMPALSSSMELSPPSELSVAAVTQPLSAADSWMSTEPQEPMATTTAKVAKRVRSSSAKSTSTRRGAAQQSSNAATRSGTTRKTKEMAEKPLFQQRQVLDQTQRDLLSARTKTRKRRRGVSEGQTEYATAPPEPPVDVTFSDVTQLTKLPADDAADTRVQFFIDDGSAVDVDDFDSSAAQLSFLRDVVEQLGGTSVGSSDDWSDGVENTPRSRGVTDAHARRVTHLVVSPHAVLTPDILYFKALGIPIVTPQWVYDAIALGGFAAVVPHLHAHPVFGDQRGGNENVNDVEEEKKTCGKDFMRAAACRIVRGGLLGEEEEDAGDEEVNEARGEDEVAPNVPSAVERVVDDGTSKPASSSSDLSFSAVPFLSSSSSAPINATLRRLHKEVVDEYVPVGEQARRPHYRPVFQDCMFYLYVPPIDLVQARRSPAPRRRTTNSSISRNTTHDKCSSRGGSYLGDVVAALEQATQLIRLLGGTVTRNLASTYLDLVVDLTGFYERTAEAGQQQQQQQQQQQRTLRESLSCAYHDALQRLSQYPDMPDFALHEARERTHPVSSMSETPSAGTPPIVGISWLLYSILQRRRADVTPFVLAAHPLTRQLAALHTTPTSPAINHNDAQDEQQRVQQQQTEEDSTVCPTLVAKNAAATVVVENSAPPAVERLVTPTFTDSSASLSSSLSVSPEVASCGTPNTARSPTPTVHLSSSSSPGTLWPSVGADPQVKTVRGPLEAQKQALHQPSTQEVTALLRGGAAASTSVVMPEVSVGGEMAVKTEDLHGSIAGGVSAKLEMENDDHSLWGHVEYSDDDDVITL